MTMFAENYKNNQQKITTEIVDFIKNITTPITEENKNTLQRMT